MQTFWFLLYNILVAPVLFIGFRIGALFDQKIKIGLHARAHQPKILEEKLATIDNQRVRLLFHCSSVGEWEQAATLIEKFKALNPQLFIIVTFFSPSGYNFVKQHPDVDLKLYLPIDTYFGAIKFLKILKPNLWFISKFDVWPNHLFAAKHLAIPVVMTAATLSSNSGRDKGLAALFNRTIYPIFSYVFPISEEDKTRFLKLFPYPDRLIVTGDTRFDRVYEKGLKVTKSEDINLFAAHGQTVFIAGSTWQPDEKALIPALCALLLRYNKLSVAIVPHELHESHLQSIEDSFASCGIKTERYTQLGKDNTSAKQVVIVNTIGLLARLYKIGHIAYVGGSFGTDGIHNVMEPAVFGQPVIFGPNYANSFEAGELIKAGAAFSEPDTANLEMRIESFLKDENLRIETGQKAKSLIESNTGAANKIVSFIAAKYTFIQH